mmetsp:Transcript_53864/g.155551  ORF Transcript_53864/g.155551 Transcript_53864/m.155551 type:complete len:277 (-) Transcript_53864:970-1800(-)
MQRKPRFVQHQFTSSRIQTCLVVSHANNAAASSNILASSMASAVLGAVCRTVASAAGAFCGNIRSNDGSSKAASSSKCSGKIPCCEERSRVGAGCEAPGCAASHLPKSSSSVRAALTSFVSSATSPCELSLANVLLITICFSAVLPGTLLDEEASSAAPGEATPGGVSLDARSLAQPTCSFEQQYARCSFDQLGALSKCLRGTTAFTTGFPDTSHATDACELNGSPLGVKVRSVPKVPWRMVTGAGVKLGWLIANVKAPTLVEVFCAASSHLTLKT